MSVTLKNKASKGIKWSLIENISNRGITFIIGIVLARLLTPADYGLIGIVLAIIVGLNAIVDSGLSQALIREVNYDNKDISSIFFLNVVISIFLSLLLFFTADTISDIIAISDKLSLIIKIMSLIIFVQAFSIIQNTLLIKDLNFKLLTVVGLVTSVCSGTLGLILAYNNYGVWSLVAQQISKSILTVLLLWILSKWRPVMSFSLRRINRFWSFGWRLSIINVIDSIWQSINTFVVGKFFSLITLGYYTKADQFNSITTQNFAAIIHKVMYPVLSVLQDKRIELLSAYKKYLRLFVYVMSYGSFCLVAISFPLIQFLLGDKWIDAAYFLQLLCVAGFVFSLHGVCLTLLKIVGNSRQFFQLDLLRKVLLLISLFIGVGLNSIYAILYSQIISNIVVILLDFCIVSKAINYRVYEQLKDVLKISLTPAFIATIIWLFTLLNLSSLITLTLQCGTGLLLVVVVAKIFTIEEFYELKKILIKK